MSNYFVLNYFVLIQVSLSLLGYVFHTMVGYCSDKPIFNKIGDFSPTLIYWRRYTNKTNYETTSTSIYYKTVTEVVW